MWNILCLAREHHLPNQVSDLLQHLGFQIVAPAPPFAIQDYLQASTYDLLLCDYATAVTENTFDELIAGVNKAQIPVIWLVDGEILEDFQVDERVSEDVYLCAPSIHETELVALIYEQILAQQSVEIDQVRAVLANQLQIQQERQLQLAQELQEELGQMLNSLKLTLTIGHELSTDVRNSVLDVARGMTSDIQHRVNVMAFDTWPFVIDNISLLPILQRCFDSFSEDVGLAITCRHLNLSYPIPMGTQVIAYTSVCDILEFLKHERYVSKIDFDLVVENEVLTIEFVGEGTLSNETILNQLLPCLRERILPYKGRIEHTRTHDNHQFLRIEVPIVLEATELAPQNGSHLNTYDCHRVAIAHQNTFIRQGLARLFENEHDVRVIGHAATLIDLEDVIARWEPDFVFLSANLVEIHEFDLIEQMKRKRADMHILLLAEGPNEKQAMEALKRGASGCVVDAFNGNEVLKAFRDVLGGRRFLSRSLLDHAIEAYIHGQTSDQEDLDHYYNLTPREKEMIQLVAIGYKSNEIAHMLSLSPRTVEKHRYNIMRKLDVSSQIELNRFATRIGLIPKDKKGEMQLIHRILYNNGIENPSNTQ